MSLIKVATDYTQRLADMRERRSEADPVNPALAGLAAGTVIGTPLGAATGMKMGDSRLIDDWLKLNHEAYLIKERLPTSAFEKIIRELDLAKNSLGLHAAINRRNHMIADGMGIGMIGGAAAGLGLGALAGHLMDHEEESQ